MKRIVLALFLLVPVVAGAQEYSWSAATMDGSRSSAVETGNAKPGCSAAKVIKIVADAQPAMSKVKEVIGVSTEALSTDYPVSALSNWTVDTIMEKVEELSGKKVRFLTGVNFHEGQKVIVDKKHVAVWGQHPVEGTAFPVGAAVLFSDKAFPTVERTGDMVRIISEPAEEVKTRILASSTKEAELNSAKRFEEYVVY